MAEKSILITGCSSGIGYATAHLLRDRGWRVIAACRQPGDVTRLADEGFEALRIDYADPVSIAEGAQYVLELTDGRLYALFNNGAFASPGAVEDLPVDALRAIFEANFFGWHDLTTRILPSMRAQRRGRIVQCSSVLGFVTLKWRGAYQATKFAVEGLTDTLRLELHGSGVKVVLIQPGPINTMIRQNSYPHFRKWIRWEGSPHAKIYPRIEERLTAEVVKSRHELGPEAVAEKVFTALEARNPRARYPVTFPTYLMTYAKRFAPTSMLDRVLRRNSY